MSWIRYLLTVNCCQKCILLNLPCYSVDILHERLQTLQPECFITCWFCSEKVWRPRAQRNIKYRNSQCASVSWTAVSVFNHTLASSKNKLNIMQDTHTHTIFWLSVLSEGLNSNGKATTTLIPWFLQLYHFIFQVLMSNWLWPQGGAPPLVLHQDITKYTALFRENINCTRLCSKYNSMIFNVIRFEWAGH